MSQRTSTRRCHDLTSRILGRQSQSCSHLYIVGYASAVTGGDIIILHRCFQILAKKPEPLASVEENVIYNEWYRKWMSIYILKKYESRLMLSVMTVRGPPYIDFLLHTKWKALIWNMVSMNPDISTTGVLRSRVVPWDTESSYEEGSSNRSSIGGQKCITILFNSKQKDL